MNDKLISQDEAARLIGITVGALRWDRKREQPSFPFVKLGPRSVRYQRSSLEAAIKKHEVGA